ncbi:MAG: T9SS type A sorting domain-containing protein [Chlorobi bacterium]|nr:T9SS type A sorting domain-containing protein [Chlorobiota bacterium]
MKPQLSIIILSVLFVLYSNIGKAQEYEYVPMPTSNALWSEIYVDFAAPPEYDTMNLKYAIFDEDTIFEGIVWQKLFMLFDSTLLLENAEFYGLLLEKDKIVYFIGPYSSGILYNFNAQVGDTITVDIPISVDFNIKKIDSIEINGKLRKRFYLWDYTGEWDTGIRWIEGIGSTNGLLWPGDWTTNENNNLLCLHHNNELIYYNNKYGTCYPNYPDSYQSVKQIENQLLKNIYPNPAKDKTKIEFPALETGQLSIHSIDGRIIMYQNINYTKSQIIDLSSIKAGIYLIKFVNNKNEMYQSKLIISK